MISQMNVVQNAARMAMDHRAARPRRRVAPAKSGALLIGGVVLLGLMVMTLVFYGTI